MEAILAELAVYNSSDLLRRFKILLSNFVRYVLEIPGISIAFIFALSIMVAAFWSYRCESPVWNCRLLDYLREWGHRSSRSVDSQIFLSEWLKVYGDPANGDIISEIFALLLHSLNYELTRMVGSVVSLHDLTLNSTPKFQLLHISSLPLGDISETVVSATVHIPSVEVYTSLESVSGDSASYASFNTSVTSKAKFFVHHRGIDLLVVHIYLLDPELCILSHRTDFDVEWFQGLLLNALQRCRTSWTPEIPSTLDPSTTAFSESRTSESTPSSVLRSRTLKSRDSAFSSSNGLKSLDCTSNQAVPWIGTATVTSSFNDIVSPSLLHYGAEVLPRDVGNTSYPQADRSEDPVILSHSAHIRQSITTCQLPKGTKFRFPRSASYYGELTSVNATAEDASDTFEQDSFDQPLNLLPNSSSAGFQPSPTSIFTSQNSGSSCGRKLRTSDSATDVHTSHMSSRDFQSSPIFEKSNVASPAATRRRCSMDNRKLIIKVVKADGLALKGTSNAYCVVELDEPYQRHTTHCSSAGQLFWDQHLLFDLNNNSKRVALEVFELAKRKKSVSKGRTELLLPSLLLTSTTTKTTEPSSPGNASGFRHRLPLLERSDSPPFACKDFAGAGSVRLGQVASECPSPVTRALLHNPVITVEFHFMERTSEEALAARLRSHGELTAATAIQRAHSSRGELKSFSAHGSPALGLTLPCESLSHSTSLEFPTTKSVLPKDLPERVDNDVVLDSLMSDDTVLQVDAEHSVVTTRCGVALEPASNISSSPIYLASRILSPVPSSWAMLEETVRSNPTVCDIPSTSHSPSVPTEPELQPTRSPPHDTSTCDRFELLEEAYSNTSLDQANDKFHGEELILDDTSRFEKDEPGTSLSSSSLQRSDLDVDVTIGSSQRFLPSSDSDFGGFKENQSSGPSSALPNFSPRSHSLATRLKPTRLLTSSVAKSSKRAGDDSGLNPSTSLALLGPSRQLASVVAGLSTLPTDPGTTPLDAAALASAIAVAGATGNWQRDAFTQGQTHVPASRIARHHVTSFDVPAHEPPLHHLPPAASVAAESPGTYTAFTQPRRSDASNLSLFRLFRHRKKRFRSVGAEKLLYLENMDLGDLDAISTEGYYRILQDNGDSQTP